MKAFTATIALTSLIITQVNGKKLGFQPDGIYTGFLSSEKQVDKILSFIDSFETDDTLVLVDPVLGDGGRTYSLYTETLGKR